MSTLDGLNDLNWWMLYVNTDYIEGGLSTFFKKWIFGSVLSDEKYKYLLLMLCESIDRIGFWYGWIFEIFENILEKFFFKKVHYFWVWWLFIVVYCDFGEFDWFMGLEFDIGWFVFCLRLIFGLFSVVINVLKPSFCIVVKVKILWKSPCWCLRPYSMTFEASAHFFSTFRRCADLISLNFDARRKIGTAQLFYQVNLARIFPKSCPK